MMSKEFKEKKQRAEKRTLRVRRKLSGFIAKPRLSISRSNRHISAQIIDDEQGITLAGYSTQSKELKAEKLSKAVARKVGLRVAEMAVAKGVERVVFDRGARAYHGMIAELAEGAREGGLKL